ncbi:MAG: aminotransferase class I/II-fold pyridoxal phosphate-dependent enzyme [Cyanobacteria bacterium]|nr:aminotransferase class I/II-fold pyridoxal phosphate-dependent enzyme [Cyanobacteriota bacterium]
MTLPPDPLAPLAAALTALPAERRRRLRDFQPGGKAELTPQSGPAPVPLLDLASNDYLGLGRHPQLLAAAHQALERDGVGSGGSRLVSGSRPVHSALERRLAGWMGRERVLLFPSGFQANLAAVGALADRHSLVIADRLCHHSLLVGVQASGARLQRFAHNDLVDLEQRLIKVRTQAPSQRLLVMSESLFSMEGSQPDAGALANLCAAHGAALLLDEAHALGVLGPGGRGLAWGQAGVTLVSGTFGKAFGGGGAFLATGAIAGEWLLQQAGAFRYTTALAPALAAAALAALELVHANPGWGPALLARADRWRTALTAAGWPRPPGQGPILSLLVGEEQAALALQQRLEDHGLLAVAIRPPTVPPGTSRLRLVLRQDLPSGSLKRLLEALGGAP